MATSRTRVARRVASAFRFGSSGKTLAVGAGMTGVGSAFTSGMFIASVSRSGAWG
jgi:hypothetical protein